MNLTLRKLAMLEKSLNEREEIARIEGYATNAVSTEFKKNVRDLMDKVRTI